MCGGYTVMRLRMKWSWKEKERRKRRERRRKDFLFIVFCFPKMNCTLLKSLEFSGDWRRVALSFQSFDIYIYTQYRQRSCSYAFARKQKLLFGPCACYLWCNYGRKPTDKPCSLKTWASRRTKGWLCFNIQLSLRIYTVVSPVEGLVFPCLRSISPGHPLLIDLPSHPQSFAIFLIIQRQLMGNL